MTDENKLATADALPLLLLTLQKHEENLKSIESKVDALLHLAIDYRLDEMKASLQDHEARLRDTEKFRWILHGMTAAISVAASALLKVLWK